MTKSNRNKLQPSDDVDSLPIYGQDRFGSNLMTIREVAKFTGVSVHTLYTMVSQRRIPFTKVGRLTRFAPDLIDKWLAAHTFLPSS